MSAKTRRLVAEALPPLTLPAKAPSRSRQSDPMPRLRRIACLLTALALPAFGTAVADTAHRADATKASQDAAPDAYGHPHLQRDATLGRPRAGSRS
ncbi:hypothetical protein JHFBIEKO_1288 [Methylobacterium mesophilicum]|nr:hypothetical protein JHFBIEKO_1288 [Methylobacterium mesophilicum]